VDYEEVFSMRRSVKAGLIIGGSSIAVVAVISLLIFGKLYLAEKKVGYCFDVAVDSSRLYVAAGKAGLHVLDVSEGALRHALTYYDRGYYRNLKLSGGRAYVADTERGLVVLDIAQNVPVTIWEQGEVKGKGVHVEGDKAYLAAAQRGLYVFDIVNPDVLRLAGRFEALEDAWDVWIYDGFAYVADLDKGLVVIDVSSPQHPRQVGFVAWTDGDAYAEIVRGEGDVAYVAAAAHGLVVIDIANPANPMVVSVYQSDPDNWVEGLAVQDSIVYLAIANEHRKSENGLHLIDVHDPYAPSLIGKIHFPDWVEGVHVAGDYAYVANTFAGVRSLNVRHLDRLSLVDTFNVTDWIVRQLR
jgi:hypothetical protein